MLSPSKEMERPTSFLLAPENLRRFMATLLREKARLAKHYGNHLERYIVKSTSHKVKPLKPKHVDIITRSTWQNDIPIDIIFDLIFIRMKEGNWVTVFKALVLIHIMMREGHTDRVFTYLSSNSHYLNLAHWKDKSSSLDGHIQAKNIRAYASYLDEKVAAYNSINYDMVKSKPEVINKFKTATYDQGGTLLDDVEVLQKLLNSLLGCTFYVEEIDNTVTLQAFRLNIGDAMTLFHLLNEGVMRILGLYFEMERPIAARSLEIYKMFAKITEKVVELFETARKLKNALGMEVPIFKHAPISLAGGLEEYLNAPNFEAQRLEVKLKKSQKEAAALASPSTLSSAGTGNIAVDVRPTKAEPKQPLIDFFSSVDEQINVLTSPQNQDAFNQPGLNSGFWASSMQPQGQPSGLQQRPYSHQPQAQGPFHLGMHSTGGMNGFMQPVPTGPMSHNPFQMQQPAGQQFVAMDASNPFRMSAPVDFQPPASSQLKSGFGAANNMNANFTVDNVFGSASAQAAFGNSSVTQPYTHSSQQPFSKPFQQPSSSNFSVGYPTGASDFAFSTQQTSKTSLSSNNNNVDPFASTSSSHFVNRNNQPSSQTDMFQNDPASLLSQGFSSPHSALPVSSNSASPNRYTMQNTSSTLPRSLQTTSSAFHVSANQLPPTAMGLPTTNGITNIKNADAFASLNPLASTAPPSATAGMSLNTLAVYNQQSNVNSMSQFITTSGYQPTHAHSSQINPFMQPKAGVGVAMNTTGAWNPGNPFIANGGSHI